VETGEANSELTTKGVLPKTRPVAFGHGQEAVVVRMADAPMTAWQCVTTGMAPNPGDTA
jgi:hypothetical protein